MEDGVTLDVPSFSSPLFSLVLNFFGSRPSKNGGGTGYYHLQRKLKSVAGSTKVDGRDCLF